MNISETEFSVPVGTVVHYQCFPGYKLEGPELLECMYNLIWSDTPPRCLDVEGEFLMTLYTHFQDISFRIDIALLRLIKSVFLYSGMSYTKMSPG